MKTDSTIVEGYFKLLNTLSIENKLDLIAKLSASVKSEVSDKKSTIEDSFGAFQSEQTAEEIIAEIRGSRCFNRKIEDF